MIVLVTSPCESDSEHWDFGELQKLKMVMEADAANDIGKSMNTLIFECMTIILTIGTLYDYVFIMFLVRIFMSHFVIILLTINHLLRKQHMQGST